VKIERLPEDRLSWKAHEINVGGAARVHIARVTGSVVRFVQQNPAQAPDFPNVPQPSGLREILNTFEESIAVVRSVLPQFDDASMQENWRMVQGDRERVGGAPGSVLAGHHAQSWYQHRGQFSVYLHVLNVAVPASWGPSTDEVPSFLQKGPSI
jgi:hypothetical protein